MTTPRRRSHHQDLVLVVLLALDVTGHGLTRGSVSDLAYLSTPDAIESLVAARLVVRRKDSGLELSAEGRAEAKLAALRIAGEVSP